MFAGGLKMKMVILALMCFSLIFATASAQGIVVPGDADGDMIVSDEELELAEQSYSEGKITSDELEEIRHIYEKYPITIVDSANRTVTIYKPAKRIISQGTWTYEPLFVLGAKDRLVAITNTAQRVYSFVPEIEDKPTVGEYREIDYEKVLENNPDLYIIGSDRDIEDIEDKLKPLGTTIVVLKFSQINKFEEEFNTLSKLIGDDTNVEAFLAWRNSQLTQIRERTETIDPKIRVYNEYSDMPWTTATSGSGTHDVITMAGGYNIADVLNMPNSAEVDPEWVMVQNPEVIIIPAFFDYAPTDLTRYDMVSTENAKQFIEDLTNRAGWKEIDAVKNGRVHVLDGECSACSCRGGGLIGVCYCVKWFYPEEFEDLDPEAIHREYFEEWLSVPYQGVWAYPQATA